MLDDQARPSTGKSMSIRSILFSILTASFVLTGCSTAGGSTREVRAPAGGPSFATARAVTSSTDNVCEPAPAEPQNKAFH